jgi:5-hydroxyisourate hydrolase
MATPSRDPITCHVLDTTTGRPAANLSVKLICCAIPDVVFRCVTNNDGRILNWHNTQGSGGSEGAFVEEHGGISATLHYMIRNYAEEQSKPNCPAESSIWRLQFDTGAHYGAANTFFPVVELSFLVKEGEHFHVPLLLAPYSFTTYRGS